MNNYRFIVFGCRPEDELLIELHTNHFKEACMLAMVNTTANYHARIWDCDRKRFIKQRVIDRAIEFYGKS
jgi:hypothetical protein